MIKAKRLFLSICAVTTMCVAAYSASVNVGYCHGQIAEEGTSKVGKTTVSAAIILTPEMLQEYKGAKVTGVRVGLVKSDGISEFTGWIRESLDGDNLDSAVAEPVAGWNMIPLGGGVVISGDSLAVGFSFHQEKSNKCISLVGKPNLNANWIAKNDKWDNNPERHKGTLSIELVVSSESIAEKDLKLESLGLPLAPVAHGDVIMANVGVRNISNSKFSGFDLKYDVDGGASKTVHFDNQLSYGDLAEVSISLNSSDYVADVPHSLNIEVVGDGDGNSANNSRMVSVGSYTQCAKRVVLIEEFTTEKCGNCPRAFNTLHECEEKGYADVMTVVAHHAGYYTDWLTTEDDMTYEWFYDPLGINGTFAPAGMLDRTVLEGKTVPVNSVGYFNEFEPLLKAAVGVPAFVTLSATLDVDPATRELKVNVKAEKMPLFDAVTDSPRISVFVVEDGVVHHHQAGISNPEFTHSHVYRTRMTDVWGTPADGWVDNTLDMNFSCKADEAWNLDNLSVVAFLHNHDAKDITSCNVLNAASVRAGQSGVDDIESESVVRYEYYTLEGMKISAPCSGVCIRRAVYSDGTARSMKVVTPGLR